MRKLYTILLLLFAGIASAGSIAGYVFQSNGVTIIAGATVGAYNSSSGAFAASNTTNAQGFFNITTLGTGNYNLTASAVSYLNKTKGIYPVNNSNPPLANYTLPNSTFKLSTSVPGNLTGFVTAASNGSAIGSANISIVGTSTSVLSGSNGNYNLTNITAPTTVNITITATGYLTATTTNIYVAPNVSTSLNFSLQQQQMGNISGTIRDASTAAVIASATISAIQNSVTIAAVNSGADGKYTLANLAPGTYSITVAKAGYGSQAGLASVVVTANQTTTSDYTLTQTASSTTSTGGFTSFGNTGYVSSVGGGVRSSSNTSESQNKTSQPEAPPAPPAEEKLVPVGVQAPASAITGESVRIAAVTKDGKKVPNTIIEIITPVRTQFSVLSGADGEASVYLDIPGVYTFSLPQYGLLAAGSIEVKAAPKAPTAPTPTTIERTESISTSNLTAGNATGLTASDVLASLTSFTKSAVSSGLFLPVIAVIALGAGGLAVALVYLKFIQPHSPQQSAKGETKSKSKSRLKRGKPAKTSKKPVRRKGR